MVPCTPVTGCQLAGAKSSVPTTFGDTEVIVAPVSNSALKETGSDIGPDFAGGLETWTAGMIWRSTIVPRKVGATGYAIGTGSVCPAAAPSDAGRSPIFLMENIPSPKRSMPMR